MNGNWPETLAQDGRLTFRNAPDRFKTRSFRKSAHAWMLLWSLLASLGIDPTPTRCPSSRLARVTLRPGAGCSEDTLDLNPRFAEWVMGWPIGWTDGAQLETEFALWLRRSRTEFSKILLREKTLKIPLGEKGIQ